MFSVTAPGPTSTHSTHTSVHTRPVKAALDGSSVVSLPPQPRPSTSTRVSGGASSIAPRRFGQIARRGSKGKLAAKVWEKQKLGLAHVHGVVSVESAAHMRWAEAYITALRDMAPRLRLWLCRRVAQGRQKVLARSAGGRLPELLRRRAGSKDGDNRERAGERPSPARCIRRTRSDESDRCTMRSLRNARRLWVSRAGLIEPASCTLDEWLAAAAMLESRRTE